MAADVMAHCVSRPWASYQIRKIAGCACAGNTGNVFPRRRFQRKPLVSDPGMHHGTCVTHVPWCMSGSLTCGDGENVPGIPGACAPALLRIWQEAHWLTLTCTTSKHGLPTCTFVAKRGPRWSRKPKYRNIAINPRKPKSKYEYFPPRKLIWNISGIMVTTLSQTHSKIFCHIQWLRDVPSDVRVSHISYIWPHGIRWKCDVPSQHTCQVYPEYFREPHWFPMGFPEISRVTWGVTHQHWHEMLLYCSTPRPALMTWTWHDMLLVIHIINL